MPLLIIFEELTNDLSPWFTLLTRASVKTFTVPFALAFLEKAIFCAMFVTWLASCLPVATGLKDDRCNVGSDNVVIPKIYVVFMKKKNSAEAEFSVLQNYC